MDSEAAAKALFDAMPHAHPEGHAPDWEIQPEAIKDVFRRRARAAEGSATMADQQDPVSQAPDQQAPVPPTQGVNHFIITATVTEVLVSVGHTRMVPNPNGTGATPKVEWLMTLSMSPSAALQLRDGLDLGLAQYAERFGKIPVDPKAQRITTSSRTKNPAPPASSSPRS